MMCAAQSADVSLAAAEAAEKEEANKSKDVTAAMEDLQLEVPTPGAAMKDALLKIKDVASDGFSKKWKLNNASGNKLAKMKYKDFQTLFAEFQNSATPAEKKAYMD